MSEVASNGVPPGWVLATIADIVDGGVLQAPPSGDGEFTYVDISRIDNQTKRVVEPKRLNTAEAPSRARQWLRSGDVLVSMTRPNLNAVAHVDDGLAGSIGSTGFHVLRSKWVEPKWLFYLVQTAQFVEQMTRLTQGALYPAVRPKDINQFAAGVPPAAEQHRIVAEIDKQFSRLDAGVAALKRVEANLRRYKAAALKAACDGSLSAPWRAAHPDVEPAEKLLSRILRERRRRWEEAELAKLVAKGKPPKDDRWKQRYKEPAPPRTASLAELPPTWCWATVEQLTPFDRPAAYGVLQPGSDVDGGIEFVRVCDIWEGAILREQLKRIAPAIAARYPRTRLDGGEVLVTIVGTIGRSAVVPAELAGANTARAVAVLPIAPPIEARYVEICFRNPAKARELTGKAHEVARKTLNLEDVRATCIPLPPQDEQAVIAEMVDDTWTIVQSVEQTVEANLKRADRLRQSILKAAFEGRLVAQDPSDEPAAALLERIRADRDAGERRNARRTRPRRRVPHG